MKRSIRHITIVVRDYDEAIDYYTKTLDFVVVEDTDVPEQNKRWVTIAPCSESPVSIVLGRASGASQSRSIGNQTGGRVFLFMETDDIARDYEVLRARGVRFVREPRDERYGTVAVFTDLYGNLWDLIQPG